MRQPYDHPGEGKLVQKLGWLALSKYRETRLIKAIDFFILTFCCLMYFANYLDRTNLNNAYVSGMREELDFKGNQLNLINTIFTVG